MYTKQKYKYLYTYEWHKKFNNWYCVGGSDLLMIGSCIEDMLRMLFPDHTTEIFNIINAVRFRNLNLDGVRIYRNAYRIFIEFERRCEYMN